MISCQENGEIKIWWTWVLSFDMVITLWIIEKKIILNK